LTCWVGRWVGGIFRLARWLVGVRWGGGAMGRQDAGAGGGRGRCRDELDGFLLAWTREAVLLSGMNNVRKQMGYLLGLLRSQDISTTGRAALLRTAEGRWHGGGRSSSLLVIGARSHLGSLSVGEAFAERCGPRTVERVNRLRVNVPLHCFLVSLAMVVCTPL
jgi:hypothetical protein